jgi:hypothetical protein
MKKPNKTSLPTGMNPTTSTQPPCPDPAAGHRRWKNMKNLSAVLTALLLLCGIALTNGADPAKVPQKEAISKITCKPRFDLQERQDLHVVDAEGNQRDAFRQWLVLEEGKHQFRISWGSPPLSRGPAELSSHEVYTFTVSTKMEAEHSVHTVLRISRGEEVVYDASEKKNNSNRVPGSD